MSNPAIQIGSNTYLLTDLYGKTLYAARPLTVFNTYAARTTSHTVTTGNPVGIVRGFVAKGYKGIAKQDFLLIGPSNAQVKCVPYNAANFSESKIQQQGVKTTRQKADEGAKADDRENQPWYEGVAKTLGPWVLVSLAAVTFIKQKVK